MRVESPILQSFPSQRIAIIGMPRSGSTIVASYINSITGAMIIGEPFLQAKRPRPEGKEWPTIVDTRYGTLKIPYGDSVVGCIDEFAENKLVQISGFKECMTAAVDVVDLVEELLPRLDLVLVVLREPRKNFMSMRQLTPEGHIPLSVEEFNQWYIKLVDFAYLRTSKIQPINLDFFRIDPALELSDATGWDLKGNHVFKSYSGGGDTNARVAQAVSPVDQRVPYAGDDILPAVNEYEGTYIASLLQKIVNGERILA